MYVRSGDLEKGVVTLEKGIAIRGRPIPLDWFFLGLAHRGLEDDEKATMYAKTLNAWLQEQQLRRRLGDPVDAAFGKTLELELKLLLAEQSEESPR